MSLSVYTLACLLVWTSRNALGSCYQIRSCGTVIYTDIFPNLYINGTSPVGNKGTMPPNVYPSVSEDALSASSIPDIRETNCHSNVSCTLMETTHIRGNLLGAVRLQWTKVTESECRMAWLKKMVERKIVVRDLEAYSKSISEKLRSEECRLKEEEREILMGVMKLKLKDEMKNLIALQRKKRG